MPQLNEAYIQTGKVYFVFRDFPIVNIHPGALLASHAANCAANQGQFWPMHDRIFAGQDANEWGAGTKADLDTFLGYADELGLDVEALRTCVQTNQSAAQIQSDYREALDNGVRSTPSFLVNGQPFIGAQPFENWQRRLDAELAK